MSGPDCVWCGMTIDAHREQGPAAKTPCGMLKRGFKPITQTSVGDVPAPIMVEVADTPFNRELRRQMAAEAEALRVDRWHATYNAALTGFLAFSGNETMNSMSLEEAIRSAKSAANQTHGALEP